MDKIQIAIVGYGKLGKGVEKALEKAPDMELFGVFSRRDPKTLNTKAFSLDDIEKYKGKIDVVILCSGSKSDVPVQGPMLAGIFNTVDAYDNHDLIYDYFTKMDEKAKKGNTVSIVGTGWDPGLFSLNRILSEAVLPDGSTYTFWGKGLSQGHSDALRRIEGVRLAAQYTIPSEEMLEEIRKGNKPNYTSKTAHKRDCYVVVEDGSDKARIENEIVHMPDYFEGYETRVNFITEEEYMKNHTGLAHGGHVLRLGQTSSENKALYEFTLDLNSNPEFTGSVNLAYARAAYRLAQKGECGAMTIADIGPGLLSPRSREEIIKELL